MRRNLGRLAITMLSMALLSPIGAKAFAQAASPDLDTTAANKTEQAIRDRVNAWTVGVAGGLLSGTFSRFAAELATALDDGDNLRVLPIVTYGATSNVSDLLYLKGIDVAITHADVFDEFKKERNIGDIDKRINYLSQMYVSELYLYVRPEINKIEDLEGKVVGLHTKGAGQTTTGPILFGRLGVNIKPVFISNKIAIEKMKTGEIAGILHSGGKPNELFKDLTPEPGFKLLPIPYSEKFADYYVPSSLGHKDYPNLFKEGESIETLGIPVVLAVYNWPKGTERFRKVERFVQYYFDRFERMRKPPFHPKWKGINLAATVPGWTRWWVAEDILTKMAAEAKAGQSENTGSTEVSLSASANGVDQELFQEFLEWKKRNSR